MNMRSFLPDHPLINALTCCANCKKEAALFQLKMCTACRSVCYCDVACQKNHRKIHKHQCNKDVQFLKDLKENINDNAADNGDNIDDDELFQPIPPKDDCPLCTLPLPIDSVGCAYSPCCGNFICLSCSNENGRVTEERQQSEYCPFCRARIAQSQEEYIARIQKRMQLNDSAAIYIASECHRKGTSGLPKDPQQAFDLCLRAAKLGNSDACHSAALFYNDGVVVPKDMAKEREYTQKAVDRGSLVARHNLGIAEWNNDNFHLASRHWLVSAAAGYTSSLEDSAKSYKNQFITKKEYYAALASYRKVWKDEWSIEREAASNGKVRGQH